MQPEQQPYMLHRATAAWCALDQQGQSSFSCLPDTQKRHVDIDSTPFPLKLQYEDTMTFKWGFLSMLKAVKALDQAKYGTGYVFNMHFQDPITTL